MKTGRPGRWTRGISHAGKVANPQLMNPPNSHTGTEQPAAAKFKDYADFLPGPDEEFYVFQNEQIKHFQKGVFHVLEAKCALKDGITLFPNGLILRNAMQPRVMAEGEAITEDGKLFVYAEFIQAVDPKEVQPECSHNE